MEFDWNKLPRHLAEMFQTAIVCMQDREIMASQPSYMLRPKLFIDGNQWCAMYGENLQDGVVGFGSSPEKAYADFDRVWREDLKKGAE